MSKRARRGLGFVVLAVLLWLVTLAARGSDGDAGQALYTVAGLAMLATGLYGLVTLAWGLIRD